MTGDQQDMLTRLRALLPKSWFPVSAPNEDAKLSGAAWALSSVYSQLTYVALQTRIKTATDGWLDVISYDFFGTDLPRLTQETDGAFRSRILANLFVKGPTRTDMANVLTLITGIAPVIFEPSNTMDSGGWDGQFYFDAGAASGGGWGDPLPYQALVTAYRPSSAAIDLGELDAYTFMFDAWGAWSDDSTANVTDAAIIAAVESTKPLGSLIWLRIANSPVSP